MASKKDMYQTKIVRTERAAAKLIRDGWEVVSGSSSGTWVTGRRTRIILQRFNPKYRGTIGVVESMTEDQYGLTLRGRLNQAKATKR